MHQLLSGYATEYAITNNLLQKTCSEGKESVFGNPSINIQYCNVLKRELEEQGHPVEMMFSNRNEVTKALSKIVVKEANRKLKSEKQPMLTGVSRGNDLQKWFDDNQYFLESQMGLGVNIRFLVGILFMTGVSMKTVPHLHRVIQADAAHMHFGKYTLFSAYGTASDGSMSPIAFGIIFGNENKESWGHFWRFAVKNHPLLNDPSVTIITDQDEGSINAIKEHLPNAHHFHCSWHRKGNIMKMCGGGKKVYSGWWYFNKLVNCNTVKN